MESGLSKAVLVGDQSSISGATILILPIAKGGVIFRFALHHRTYKAAVHQDGGASDVSGLV